MEQTSTSGEVSATNPQRAKREAALCSRCQDPAEPSVVEHKTLIYHGRRFTHQAKHCGDTPTRSAPFATGKNTHIHTQACAS
jgi:hypothetical protein